MKLIGKNSFIAALDLEDAYYMIPISDWDKKYLRFIFAGDTFEFVCLPFGLSTESYVFTKVMKPIVAHLRNLGYASVIYRDDLLLISISYEECLNNRLETCSLLRKLEFIINEKKSQIVPSKKCRVLGLIFNSKSMTVELPDDKKSKTLRLIKRFSSMQRCKIRDFAKFIRILGSCCLVIRYGWVHMKDFEREKYLALKTNNDNFQAFMHIANYLTVDFEQVKD